MAQNSFPATGPVNIGGTGNMILNVTANNPNGMGIMVANSNTSPAGNWIVCVQGNNQYHPRGFSLYDQRAGNHRFMIDANGTLF